MAQSWEWREEVGASNKPIRQIKPFKPAESRPFVYAVVLLAIPYRVTPKKPTFVEVSANV
jgi:hypothetical protein